MIASAATFFGPQISAGRPRPKISDAPIANALEAPVYRRIVVKLGTSVLTQGTQRLDRAHMVELVRQCAQLRRRGVEVVLCSSGAIAAGRERLADQEIPDTVRHKQMLAAVGQSRLMLYWERLFDLYELRVGQVLLTGADVTDRSRYLNARSALRTLLDHGIIPVINENDAVATNEIKVGDNDNLSALVAILAEADLLLLLTDQPGLYTADPRTNPSARLIPQVRQIDETLRSIAGGSVSGLGVGGMATKLQAADSARRSGIDVVITSGHTPDAILQSVFREAPQEPAPATPNVTGDFPDSSDPSNAGGSRKTNAPQHFLGTYFPAIDTPLESRKQWIFASQKPKGVLEVDQGAVRALQDGTSSLLPTGITQVSGDFDSGDAVRIVDGDGAEIARGISRYDSHDMHRIRGLRTESARERLGDAFHTPVAVNRRDMILM